nr:hypothetical protein [Tanacetum cinerariifolium]
MPIPETERWNQGDIAPKSPDHNSSSDDSSDSTNDDMTESRRESDHDESDNDSEHGDESDKSAYDEESTESDESDNNSDNADEQTKELLLPKAVSNALKKTPVNLSHPTPTPSVDPSEYELKHKLYEKIFQTAAYLKHHKHRPEDREGEKSKKRDCEMVLDHEQVHGSHKVQAKEFSEKPEEHEYKYGSVTLFGKLVKKIEKDKITKEDVDDPAFELLKGSIDWINPEGDIYHQDLSKPLPLTEHPGKKRIPVNYFFNHDLEYLVKGPKERTYALFVTKIKAARYEDEGIEEMIPSLWSSNIQKYNKDADFGICHWTMIKKRVEDVQMGVESYHTKLNLTKPQLMEEQLMIDNELHKFCDGTLNKVLSKFQIILRNNRLGYDNEGMEKYKWTKEDEKKTKKFVDKIEKTLKERKRFTRLELFVGGRRDKTDYRLLVRPG